MPDDHCFEFREDYFECLHSNKEMARVRRVLQEARKEGIDTKTTG